MALETTQYVAPGSYIAQLIRPQPGTPTAMRIPVYIGKGSKRAVGRNLGIRRSFVYEETLTVSTSQPHQATLVNYADGDQEFAQLYKQDGTLVSKGLWRFVKTGANYDKIEIQPEIFEQTATYKIDYQSTSRDIKDPMPVDDIRQITSVGNFQDQAEYTEYVDFIVDSSFSAFTGTQTNDATSIEAPVADVGNTGGLALTINSGATYTGKYTRSYYFEVTAFVAATSVTFEWSTTREAGGDATGTASIPLDSSASNPSTGVITHSGGTVQHAVELGIILDVDGTADPVVGDKWTFNALGAALVEPDPRHTNTNQLAEFGTPTADVGNTGTFDMDVASDAAYIGTSNVVYHLECTAVTPATDADFIWEEVGYRTGVSGTLNVTAASPTGVTLGALGLKIDFDFTGDPDVGDKWTISGNAARVVFQGKDDRQYTLTVATATNPTATKGSVTGSYVTNTPEGGNGSFSADYEEAQTDWGEAALPDSLTLFFRNMVKQTSTTDGNQHTASDTQIFTITNDDVINWSLQQRTTEQYTADEVLLDVTGGITGTAGTYYVILSKLPDTIERVWDPVTTLDLSYTQVTDTPYVYFTAQPPNGVYVKYLWRSEEPDPGQLYFLTGQYWRPDSLYNTPSLVRTKEDGQALLSPPEPDNDLYIMNDLAWHPSVDVNEVYYVQAQDADLDGTYTDTDFLNAINAAETPSRIRDVVVLNHWTSLGDSLAHVDKMNDPFEKRERLLWVGAPIGTSIGDVDTADTLVYTAKKTLQVYGDTPSHGTRLMVGSVEAKHDLRLIDGSEIEVALDGSFVAGALAGIAGSFNSPANSLLRKQLTAFKEITVHGPIDSADNKALGAARIIYLTEQGTGIYRIEENTTTDTFADDFTQDLYMFQKQFTTDYIRTETDQKLVGIVTASTADALALIRGFVATALDNLVGLNLIARYQDEDTGAERPLDPDKDIIVYQDTTDRSQFTFYFAYFLRGLIKRLFGLYVVNTNDFGSVRP